MVARELCVPTVFVALLVAAAVPPSVEAQVFTQAYVGIGYVDGFTGLLGLNILRDLTAGDEDRIIDEPGPVLNGLVAVGVRSNETQITGMYGVGVVFPTGGPNLGYIGPVGVGSVHPWGAGGGVRLAAGFGAGLAWLTAGVIKLQNRSGVRVLVDLDLTQAFVCDITPVC